MAGEEPPWHEILRQLHLTGSALHVASHAELVDRKGDRWRLCLSDDRGNLFNDRHVAVIGKALSKWRGRETYVEITPGRVTGETPAARTARLEAERLAEARDALRSDPRVQELLVAFEAQLLDESVTVDKP